MLRLIWIIGTKTYTPVPITASWEPFTANKPLIGVTTTPFIRFILFYKIYFVYLFIATKQSALIKGKG